MSVYAKETPDFLRESLDSMFSQTIPTDDFVLVCDGPLTDELNIVIAQYEEKYSSILHVLRLPQNVGLGKALSEGLALCKNELVARMDSDDISRPERCELQLDYFETHPEVSVISGTVEEFAEIKDKVHASRMLPESHADIISFAKTRNPFNHPCVMFKKSAVETAGGYQDFYLLEDYYLWLRMLSHGFIGANIVEPLLWMRADYSMYKRRGGWKQYASCIKLLVYMRKKNICSRLTFYKAFIQRSIFSLSPGWFRTLLYKHFVRTKI